MQTPRSSIKRVLDFGSPSHKTMGRSKTSCHARASMKKKMNKVKKMEIKPKAAMKRGQPKAAMKRGKVRSKTASDVQILDSAALDQARATLNKKWPGKHDVMEIFSCPRLVPMATQAFKMQASISLDLAHGWDGLNGQHQRLSWHLLRHVKPGFLMCSPPCTYYSPLQKMWNFPRMPKWKVREMKVDADQMVDLSADQCLEQVKRGRLFCFEHPAPAGSWSSTKLATYVSTPGTFQVTFDQCAVGLKSPLGTPMKKRTRFWTNSKGICQVFSEKQCSCEEPHRRIEGQECGYRLSKWAQRYPAPMVKAILQGVSLDLKR